MPEANIAGSFLKSLNHVRITVERFLSGFRSPGPGTRYRVCMQTARKLVEDQVSSREQLFNGKTNLPIYETDPNPTPRGRRQTRAYVGRVFSVSLFPTRFARNNIER